MAEPKLYDFIIHTVTKPGRLAKAMHQPEEFLDAAYAAGALSEDHRSLLLSGDSEAITQALFDEAGVAGEEAKVAIWVLLILGPHARPPSSAS